ncbi:MAG: gas vesicle protein [Parvularculaceae bacterium]|nr:gas vesicle protein [Parvularculaceae bacterium]
MSSLVQQPGRADGLGDILERVLDKGVVIAGDVAISLVGIELLTIRLRLIIASVDKAVEMGINWWETDPTLSAEAKMVQQELADDQVQALAQQNEQLRLQIERLEDRLAASEG